MKTIDRRRFAQLALCAPFVFHEHASAALEATVRTALNNRSHFPILDVTGSYREIGFAIGRRFGKNIREVIRRRAEWHQGLMTLLHSPTGRRRSQKLLDLTRKHFPHLLDELRGTAEGAGLHFDATKGYAYEDQQYRGGSSMSRYTVLQRLIAGADAKTLKPETLLGFLSSHEQAPYSPCRHPKGDVRGQTLGTAFFDIGRGVFRLYTGNPCEAVVSGTFVEYHF